MAIKIIIIIIKTINNYCIIINHEFSLDRKRRLPSNLEAIHEVSNEKISKMTFEKRKRVDHKIVDENARLRGVVY